MKKLFFLLLMLPFLASAQPQLGNLPPLHVDGKYFKDVHGNRVVMHGCMDTPSMYFNGGRWTGGYNATGAANCKKYFTKLYEGMTCHEQGAYCTLFRLHMDPAWLMNGSLATGFKETGGKTYDPHGNEVGGEANVGKFNLAGYKTYLKSLYVPLALDALKHGLYVIVRPPGVCPGYIQVGDYYNDYLTTVWDLFSQNDSIRKYSGQIMIELANEPVTLKNSQGQSDPKALHDFFQPIVEKIRSNGYDGIILAPGTGWQSNYSDYGQYPIEGANIGYAVHNYSGWYGGDDGGYDRAANKQTYINNYVAQFKKQVPVVETNPIVITEVDWSPQNESTGHYNEHGDWVVGNYGTWATGSTSKWGACFKKLLDTYGNISMTLTSIDCYFDIDQWINKKTIVPGFKAKMEANGVDPYEASGQACMNWYADYYKVDRAHAAYQHTWTADNGAGKYVNPIINGDFPDPDVIRVGDTYYMVSTTMYIFPGATIMKSKDLVNWEYCANPLLQIDDNDAYNLLNGHDHYAQGQWASSLSYHNGKFYLYFISYGRNGVDSGRNVMLTTTNPEGKWDMEFWPEHYYDSGWLFDDGEKGDGNVYVACGIGDIYVNKLDGKTLKKISSTKVISGRDGLEGSHMYHIGDFYYLYLTTGGYWRGQTIYRSQNPMGPYEEMPNLNNYGNPQSGNAFSSSAIHQGALVETQTGEWWTIMFKDAGAIGRIPYLEPVTWQDGWPIIGNKGTDVSKMTSTTGSLPKYYTKPNVGGNHSRTYLPTNDTFTELTLGMQWGWNHNPDNKAWSLLENPGNLRLHTSGIAPTLDRARNSLTQRILGYNCEGFTNATKETKSYGTIKLNVANMTEGDIAGLSVFQDPYSYIGIKMVDGKRHIYYYHSEYDDKASSEVLGDIIDADVVYLRAIVSFVNNTVDYYYSTDNETYTKFGNGMKPRFTLKIFVGQRFYLFNFATKQAGGYVDIDWFSTEPEYSEEMFYGEGVLHSFTTEDATAKELSVSQTDFNLMPGCSQQLDITCTMLSGLTSNVSSGCSYKIDNSAVATVQNGRIVALSEGSTNITATYTDPIGGQVSVSFSVNVSYFPISVDAFEPNIVGTGSAFKMIFNGLIGQYKPTAKAFGGWHYDTGIDLSKSARYLVAQLQSVSLAAPALRIYDTNDATSTSFYSMSFGSKKVIAIDLEEAAKTIDLSHIYYIGFYGGKSNAMNIEKVFLSDDGETPTAVESIEGTTVGELLSVQIFTLDGRRQTSLQRGTNIVRKTYSDGRVETNKIIKH